MPNWSVGSLTLEGSKEDIKRFLNEGLKATLDIDNQVKSMMGEAYERPDVKVSETDTALNVHADHGFYIVGTHRAFCDGEIEFIYRDLDTQELNLNGFRQAYVVQTGEYIDISSKYNLDIYINTMEPGMGSEQSIIIKNGEVIKDEYKEWTETDFDEFYGSKIEVSQ